MRHRLRFFLRKLLRIILLLLGVSAITFALMCASPLDPLQTNVGPVSYTHLDVYKRQLRKHRRLLAMYV